MLHAHCICPSLSDSLLSFTVPFILHSAPCLVSVLFYHSALVSGAMGNQADSPLAVSTHLIRVAVGDRITVSMFSVSTVTLGAFGGGPTSNPNHNC
jgi:hypothetical protein